MKQALVIAAAIIGAVAIYVYNSPFQSCMRSGMGQSLGASYCARITSGNH